MSASKKYKLLSMSASDGGKRVCAFISSPGGCRNGDKCAFLHTTGDTFPVADFSENTSVISSESEGGVTARLEKVSRSPATKPKNSGDSEAVEKGKQPRKNKRKTAPSASDDDLFANPGKRPGVLANDSTAHNTPNKKQRQMTTTSAGKTAKNKNTANPAADFRSFVLSLPVASFSIGEDGNSAKKTENNNPPSDTSGEGAAKISSSKKEDQLPLPTSTEVGRKWQKAVLASRDHERYANAFDFAKYKDLEEKAGIQSKWIKAKPFGSWSAKNPQAIAIDCEMCETQDPLSGGKNPKALCRLSVVNAEKPEEVLLDTLVKPDWPVSDYRKRINGIGKEDLENVEFTLRHAQAFMMALCSDETVIVGHAVHNDLAALSMEHHCLADSSFLFHGKDSTTASVSLRDLVTSIFQKDMPETHDSVNDARKAFECVLHWVENDGKVEAIERTPRNKGHQLFIHRVPKQCKAQHLTSMFLKHTSIEPTDVEPIEFPGETGKTHVTFKTARHAHLAFDTLEGVPEQDKSGRLQKKVYLRTGDYVRVRKMVFTNRGANSTPIKTPNKQ